MSFRRALPVVLCLACSCGAAPSDLELPGARVWVRNFPQTNARLVRTAIGPDDSIVVAMLSIGAAEMCGQELGSTGAVSLVVANLGPEAECPGRWIHSLDGDWASMAEPSYWDSPRLGLAVQPNGDILLTAGRLVGTFDLDVIHPTFDQPNGLLFKLDGANGSVRWARGTERTGLRLEPRDIALSDGDIYMAASGADPPFGVWVGRRDGTDGSVVWEQYFAVTEDNPVGATASRVAVRDETLVVTGQYVGDVDFGSGARLEIEPSLAEFLDQTPARFELALDAMDGSPLWARAFNDAHPGELQVAIDSTGRLVIVGDLAGGEGFELLEPTLTVVRMDREGKTDWHRSWSGPSAGSGADVALDASDNILASGSFAGEWSFGGRPVFAEQEALYVAKVESAGRPYWARFTARTGPVTAADVLVAADGRVIGSGVFVPAGADSHDDPPAQLFLIKLEP